MPGKLAIISLGGRSGNDRLHAAGLSAITGSAAFIQEIMSPFAADPMTPTPDLAVDDDAAADTRPHDDAKNHPRPGHFPADDPPMCFRQRKAIGIIGQHDRDAEPGGQVILKGLSIQNNRIAIFHRPESRVQNTRRSKSDRRGASAPIDVPFLRRGGRSGREYGHILWRLRYRYGFERWGGDDGWTPGSRLRS